MASDKMITLNEDNFETEVLQSELPILVDFWAQWCGPCRMVAPVLEELADEMDGTVRFGKLNIDEYQGIACKYGVLSIPTFILFKRGQMADRITGARPKPAFQNFIDRNI